MCSRRRRGWRFAHWRHCGCQGLRERHSVERVGQGADAIWLEGHGLDVIFAGAAIACLVLSARRRPTLSRWLIAAAQAACERAVQVPGLRAVGTPGLLGLE